MSTLAKLLSFMVAAFILGHSGLVLGANTLQVIEPSGGSVLSAGGPINVKWSGTWDGTSTVRIVVFKGTFDAGFYPALDYAKGERFVLSESVNLSAGSVSGILPGNLEESEFYFVGLVAQNKDTYMSASFRIKNDGPGATKEPAPGGGTAKKLPESVASGYAAPQDLDGDGIFEDVDGNGTFALDDCILLAKQLPQTGADALGVIGSNPDSFDFNKGDGKLNFGDVLACLEKLRAGGPAGLKPLEFDVTAKRLDGVGKVEFQFTKPSDYFNCSFIHGDGSPAEAMDFDEATSLQYEYQQTGNYTAAYRCFVAPGKTIERRIAVVVDVGTGGVSGGDPQTQKKEEPKQEAPKTNNFTVLFVPFNYTSQAAVNADVEKVRGFLSGKLFSLTNISDVNLNLKVYPTVQKCSNFTNDECHDLLFTLNGQSPDAGRTDLALGICASDTCLAFKKMDGAFCSGVSTGGARGLGTGVAIIDMFECNFKTGYRITAERTALHEIGHTMGLGHIAACQQPERAGSCVSGSSSYNPKECQNLTRTFCNPQSYNSGDCSDPNKDTNYMTYCLVNSTHFGPQGTKHMNDQIKQELD